MFVAYQKLDEEESINQHFRANINDAENRLIGIKNSIGTELGQQIMIEMMIKLDYSKKEITLRKI